MGKTRDTLTITILYALAAMAAAAVYVAARRVWLAGPLLALAIADLVGTAVVFGFSYRFNNSSLYDPYWSVAPPLMATFWWVAGQARGEFLGRALLVLGLMVIWAARLTFNWAVRWGGLGHEDWRYVAQREVHRHFYWPVSFLGIHLMPTVLVFLGCLPLIPALGVPRQPWNNLDLFAALLTVAAILVEARADLEVTRFKGDKQNQGKLLVSGLWRYCRHPNYLGEMAFWWGLFFFGLAANPSYLWTVAGAGAISLLFVTISIPMMEKRFLSRYPEYEAYRRRTASLFPWCRSE